MEHSTFFWNMDHTQLFGQSWTPKKNPQAVIVLVHGLGEHSSRYQHVAEMFVNHAMACVACDHRGHGLSTGKRGHVDSYDIFCEEIDRQIDYARELAPNVPIFVYGHSLGGALVLYYGLKYHPAVRGIIATSPGLAPAKTSPLVVAAGKVLSSLAPSLILKNGLDLSGISHDAAVVEAYKNDPLNHPDISARLGMELINNGAWICAHANEFPLPLLLLQGSEDRLVSIAATRAFAGSLKHDLTYKEWPGGYHELHNEPDKAQVFACMLDWIDQQLHPSPA